VGRILNYLEIEGFKSIRSAKLELPRLNLLIGANGVGKSNFISLFRLLNQVIESSLQVYAGQSGGADSILHFGAKRTQRLRIRLEFADRRNGYECSLVPSTEGELVFREESVWFHDKKRYPTKPYIEVLGSGHKETRLFDRRGKPTTKIAAWVIQDLQSWRIYHFHDTSAEAGVKQSSDLHDNRILRGDASNLAAFLFRLREQHPDDYHNIVDAVRMVGPFFDDFVLKPSELNKEKIRLEWREKGSDAYFGPAVLSDGTLRFMCLATLLLQPDLPSTILLDEPELGLHPCAITLLADLLRGASTKTQVIAATQSVTLLNQFEPSDVLVVDRNEGQSEFRHLDESAMQDWLQDYGLGDLWEKNVFGGRP
jgi:predicted ATPase